MARDDVILRAQPLGDQLSVIGTDAARGVTVEGLKLGVDDWGPHDLGCTLQRDPNLQFADLAAATPLEVEIGGSLLWSGRIAETPGSEDNRQIAINGQGWQFHTDDDNYYRSLVLTDQSQWGNIRNYPTCDLGFFRSVWQLSTDQGGGLIITAPNGVPVETQSRGGYLLDLGPNVTAAGLSFTYGTSGNAANVALVLTAGNNVNSISTGSYTNPSSLGPATGGFYSTTFSASRYVFIGLLNNTGSPVTPGADVWVRLSGITVFTNNTFNSGGASILHASDIVSDAVTQATQLSQDKSLISATSFVIPTFAATGFQSPRTYVNAVNAYHNYQARVRADKRMEFRPRPTAPLLTVVNGKFDNTSLGSTDQVYNKCIGTATGPDGVAITSTQVASPATTIFDRRGYYKTNVLDTNMALTQAALDQMTSVFLQGHTRTPFKGTLTVTGFEAVAFTIGGAFVPAWELLQYVGEMIHFPNQIDPDTGAKGRDGRISAVSYDHDSRTASVSIDSQRSNFEALLARLQVVTGQVH